MSLLSQLLGIDDEELARLREMAKDYFDQKRKIESLTRDQATLRKDMANALNQITGGGYGTVVRSVLDNLDQGRLREMVEVEVQKIIQTETKTAIQQALESNLASQIWDELDIDTFVSNLSEKIIASEAYQKWFSDNAKTLAEAIAESIRENDDLDLESFENAVAEALVNRIQLVPPENA